VRSTDIQQWHGVTHSKPNSLTTTISPIVPEASPTHVRWFREAHDTRPVRHHASSARQVTVQRDWRHSTTRPSVAKQQRAVRTSSSNSCESLASDSRCDACV
jgi:hypothetical protein